MSTISVVIATKNRPDDLLACLASIRAQTYRPSEIVVVDSSRTDGLRSRLRTCRSELPVRYLYAEANLSEARNIGIDQAGGEIVTFLDDDVVLEPDCVSEIHRIFAVDAAGTIGGVAAERVLAAGRGFKSFVLWHVLVPCYQVFARLFLLLRYGDGRFQVSGLPTIIRGGTLERPVDVEYVVGANMSFRREVVREFRFDPQLAYFDDSDFPLRVSRKWRIVYAPRARFVHHVVPGGQDRGLRRWRKDLRGYRRYLAKNFPRTLRYRLIYWWVALGLFIRAILLIAVRPFVRGYSSV